MKRGAYFYLGLIFINLGLLAFTQMALRDIFCPLSSIEVWFNCGESFLLPSLVFVAGVNIHTFKKASQKQEEVK